ncbi:hypothetical protein ACFU9F_14395 [Streptomyces zhihengii]|uniref:hypothetical protein n=1 Tax=Streptomyces zhihengii TaxID=1818004 RepID=UPI0036A523E6
MLLPRSHGRSTVCGSKADGEKSRASSGLEEALSGICSPTQMVLKPSGFDVHVRRPTVMLIPTRDRRSLTVATREDQGDWMLSTMGTGAMIGIAVTMVAVAALAVVVVKRLGSREH